MTDGPSDRGIASDIFQTYMMMLLIGAPVLIDDPVARRFLEQGWDRYRGSRKGAGTGSEPTGEVFIDPATGQRMRVWYDPATGSREYRAE